MFLVKKHVNIFSTHIDTKHDKYGAKKLEKVKSEALKSEDTKTK